MRERVNSLLHGNSVHLQGQEPEPTDATTTALAALELSMHSPVSKRPDEHGLVPRTIAQANSLHWHLLGRKLGRTR